MTETNGFTDRRGSSDPVPAVAVVRVDQAVAVDTGRMASAAAAAAVEAETLREVTAHLDRSTEPPRPSPAEYLRVASHRTTRVG